MQFSIKVSASHNRIQRLMYSMSSGNALDFFPYFSLSTLFLTFSQFILWPLHAVIVCCFCCFCCFNGKEWVYVYRNLCHSFCVMHLVTSTVFLLSAMHSLRHISMRQSILVIISSLYGWRLTCYYILYHEISSSSSSSVFQLFCFIFRHISILPSFILRSLFGVHTVQSVLWFRYFPHWPPPYSVLALLRVFSFALRLFLSLCVLTLNTVQKESQWCQWHCVSKQHQHNVSLQDSSEMTMAFSLKQLDNCFVGYRQSKIAIT